MQNDFNKEIISFFETIEKYYGSKIEVSIGLFSEKEISNNSLATWNLMEFNLIQSGYRKAGDKFMVEGKGVYFELSAEKLIDFKQTPPYSEVVAAHFSFPAVSYITLDTL